MQNDTTTTVHVALDVHKDSVVAAYSVGLGEVQHLGNVGVLERDITKLSLATWSSANQLHLGGAFQTVSGGRFHIVTGGRFESIPGGRFGSLGVAGFDWNMQRCGPASGWRGWHAA